MLGITIKCRRCGTKNDLNLLPTEAVKGRVIERACTTCEAKFGFKLKDVPVDEIAPNSKFGLGKGRKE